jgi:sec-independent protein translocase protein TatA
MPDLGWQELAIILVIVVIIFGAGKLPEIGGALGKSIKEFKANSDGILDDKKSPTQSQAVTGSRSPASGVTISQELRADEI